ncbi:MAG: ribokinase [Prolixibacteraceae bacterium]|nr:ribokinase [Prolixibacteraceae bacterium]
MKPKILVIGSSNTDMVVKVPRIPSPGETVLGSDFIIAPGGKGANQAVASSRAGSEVVFIAAVSDDSFGKESVENYKREGIDTSYIKIKSETHSGIALINVASDGENSISVASGANNLLLPDDIYSSVEAFEEAAVVLVQLEIPMETVAAVSEISSSKGIPLILNPAPASVIPEIIYSRIEVLTPNETEAEILTGSKAGEIPEMARELFDKGAEAVIITLGRKGVYLKNSEFSGYIKGYTANAVDTTAAGDVFNGALASALANKISLFEAIDFAQRAAAISVTRMGAQPSAPELNEINSFKNLNG